jgi:hypothetical protein
MEKHDKKALIGIFLIILITILVINVNLLQITYYSEFDMLGPLSIYPAIILAQLILPIIFVVILLKQRTASLTILLIPFILLIFVKYLCPELMEKYYVVSFYDGWQLFNRGSYVTIYGRSNPQADPYFDVQSGFFWTTAVLLIVSGIPASSANLSFMLFAKLFPVITSIIYLPLLFLLYKRLLVNRSLAALALTIHFDLIFHNLHYSSQTYALSIYWLILFLIFASINSRDTRYTILAIVVGSSLIFLHQGVILFTILTLLASTFHPLFFRILSKDTRFYSKKFLILIFLFFTCWIAYLTCLTTLTFRSFIETLRLVIEKWISIGVKIFPQIISRTYADWERFVYFKAFYLSALIFVGLLFSFINAIKSGDEEDKMAFSIQFLLTMFIGAISIALGGAGYVERIPMTLLPLIIYSLLKFFAKINIYRFTRLCLAMLFVVLMLSGSIIYFSGRNFQSILAGVHHSRIFLANKDPKSIDGIYAGSKTVSIRDVVVSYLSNASIPISEFIIVEKHAIIETFYYVCANMSIIEGIVKDLSCVSEKIYDNKDATIMYAPKIRPISCMGVSCNLLIVCNHRSNCLNHVNLKD